MLSRNVREDASIFFSHERTCSLMYNQKTRVSCIMKLRRLNRFFLIISFIHHTVISFRKGFFLSSVSAGTFRARFKTSISKLRTSDELCKLYILSSCSLSHTAFTHKFPFYSLFLRVCHLQYPVWCACYLAEISKLLTFDSNEWSKKFIFSAKAELCLLWLVLRIYSPT